MDKKCEKDSIKVLEELHKNVSMGKESLVDVMPKVKDAKLKDELTEQFDGYTRFSDEINELMRQCGGETKTEGIITKMSAKLGVGMSTLTDSSEAHIAQMVIEGTTMGITETIRSIRDNENSSCCEDALALARKIVSFQEKAVERTKNFL